MRRGLIVGLRCAIAAFATLVGLACTAQPRDERPSDQPSAGDVLKPAEPVRITQSTKAQRAVKDVLNGPEFEKSEKVKTPRIKWDDEKKTKEPDWVRNLENFFRALAGLLRAGVWVLGAVLVLVLLFTLHYWWRMRDARIQAATIELPTHVGGLDIRKESLPADIAAAARAKLDAGDISAALSLLYRGALSTLVNRHGCAISASFTEDECVAAARKVLLQEPWRFVERLARSWVLTTYGGRTPDAATAMALCDGYVTHFAPREAPAP
jgi:hypothetical protein